jgi:hypothetical protein
MFSLTKCRERGCWCGRLAFAERCSLSARVRGRTRYENSAAAANRLADQCLGWACVSVPALSGARVPSRASRQDGCEALRPATSRMRSGALKRRDRKAPEYATASCNMVGLRATMLNLATSAEKIELWSTTERTSCQKTVDRSRRRPQFLMSQGRLRRSTTGLRRSIGWKAP